MNSQENTLAAKLLEEAEIAAKQQPEKALLLMQAYNQLMQAAAARAKTETP